MIMEISVTIGFVIESNLIYPDHDNPEIYNYQLTDTNMYIYIYMYTYIYIYICIIYYMHMYTYVYIVHNTQIDR